MLLSLITAVTIALSALNPAPTSEGCVPSVDAKDHSWIPYEQTGYVNPDGTPVMGWCWTGGGHWHGQGMKPDYTPPMVERKPINPAPRVLSCHYPGWVNMDSDDPEYFMAWNRAYMGWKTCLATYKTPLG